MQRNGVPAIQCVVGLCRVGVGLLWWQSLTVVRSLTSCVVSDRFDLQGIAGNAIDWVDFRGDWTINCTHLLVHTLTLLSRSSLIGFASQAACQQPVDWANSVLYWAVDIAQ